MSTRPSLQGLARAWLRGTVKFGGLSFSYTSLRDIVLNPQTTIQSTQIKGSSR